MYSSPTELRCFLKEKRMHCFVGTYVSLEYLYLSAQFPYGTRNAVGLDNKNILSIQFRAGVLYLV